MELVALQKLFAAMVYQTNKPNHIVENPALQTLFHTLAPGVKVPSRYDRLLLLLMYIANCPS